MEPTFSYEINHPECQKTNNSQSQMGYTFKESVRNLFVDSFHPEELPNVSKEKVKDGTKFIEIDAFLKFIGTLDKKIFSFFEKVDSIKKICSEEKINYTKNQEHFVMMECKATPVFADVVEFIEKLVYFLEICPKTPHICAFFVHNGIDPIDFRTDLNNRDLHVINQIWKIERKHDCKIELYICYLLQDSIVKEYSKLVAKKDQENEKKDRELEKISRELEKKDQEIKKIMKAVEDLKRKHPELTESSEIMDIQEILKKNKNN